MSASKDVTPPPASNDVVPFDAVPFDAVPFDDPDVVVVPGSLLEPIALDDVPPPPPHQEPPPPNEPPAIGLLASLALPPQTPPPQQLPDWPPRPQPPRPQPPRPQPPRPPLSPVFKPSAEPKLSPSRPQPQPEPPVDPPGPEPSPRRRWPKLPIPPRPPKSVQSVVMALRRPPLLTRQQSGIPPRASDGQTGGNEPDDTKPPPAPASESANDAPATGDAPDVTPLAVNRLDVCSSSSDTDDNGDEMVPPSDDEMSPSSDNESDDESDAILSSVDESGSRPPRPAASKRERKHRRPKADVPPREPGQFTRQHRERETRPKVERGPVRKGKPPVILSAPGSKPPRSKDAPKKLTQAERLAKLSTPTIRDKRIKPGCHKYKAPVRGLAYRGSTEMYKHRVQGLAEKDTGGKTIHLDDSRIKDGNYDRAAYDKALAEQIKAQTGSCKPAAGTSSKAAGKQRQKPGPSGAGSSRANTSAAHGGSEPGQLSPSPNTPAPDPEYQSLEQQRRRLEKERRERARIEKEQTAAAVAEYRGLAHTKKPAREATK